MPQPAQRPKRPAKARSIQQRRFLRTFARAGQDAPALHAARVSATTLAGWLRLDPSFAGRYHEAQADFRDRLYEGLVTSVEKGSFSALRTLAQLELPEKYGRPDTRHSSEALIHRLLDCAERN